MNYIKFIVFNFCRARGIWIQLSPTKNEIELLLKKFKPKVINKDLIRIGSDGDGGYIIPDDLGGISSCLSPGVDRTSDFEDELSQLEINSYLLDASVTRPPISNPKFTFRKNFLGSFDSGEYISIETWLLDVKEKPDYILQMDIEGYEYEVLESISKRNLLKFRILVIEFHCLEKILNPFFFDRLTKIMDIILEHFVIAHTHMNNSDRLIKYKGENIPRTMEVSFIRKDRVKIEYGEPTLPNKLDKLNRPELQSYPYPKCWKE